MTTLYNTDVLQWARQQAALLQAGRYAELDIPNLVEEIESLGHKQTELVENGLDDLCRYFLFPVTPRTWHNVMDIRFELESVLEDNATLQATVEELLPEAYQHATTVLHWYFPGRTVPAAFTAL